MRVVDILNIKIVPLFDLLSLQGYPRRCAHPGQGMLLNEVFEQSTEGALGLLVRRGALLMCLEEPPGLRQPRRLARTLPATTRLGLLVTALSTSAGVVGAIVISECRDDEPEEGGRRAVGARFEFWMELHLLHREDVSV